MTSSDILNEIKRIAKEVLPKGGQLILYGSRARNEATEDSDWDLLILLDKPKIEHGDYDNVLYPFAALSWDVGEQISPIIYTKNEWNKYSFTPFYKNVEQKSDYNCVYVTTEEEMRPLIEPLKAFIAKVGDLIKEKE